ncbi:MAG: PAS domain-containing protein [Phycisphaerales bacterium]|nr:PAS domain-containing protein [Phycisphaerae bacterium]NNM27322.1 PAS domain-containing protein [Phycisphaerales bacterium]
MSRRPIGLFAQLVVALMGVQALVAVVLVIATRHQIQRFQVEQTAAELDRLAPLVAEQCEPRLAPSERATLQSQVDRLARSSETRISIVGETGQVLADSAHDPALLDDHRFRPEIDAAFAAGVGRAERFSATLDREMIYVARRVNADPLVVVRLARPRADIGTSLAPLYRNIGLAALLLFLLTLAVTFVVSRRLSRTVDRLARDATRFARGELAHRASAPGTRELGQLAGALNDMARALDGQINQLQSQRAEQRAILESMSNGMLAIDDRQRILSANRAAERMLGFETAVARHRLLQEVIREPALNTFIDAALATAGRRQEELVLEGRAARVNIVSGPLLDADDHRVGLLMLLEDVTQLRRLETMRSDFAANVSHELRTPITNIKGYVETLEDVGTTDRDQTNRFLRIVHDNANRLEAIIEDLLSLARLEQDDARDELPLEEVRLIETIEAALRPTAARRAAKSIDVAVEADETLRVVAVPRLLEQALGNLISNAVNYSPAGTTVTIRCARDNDDVRLEVADQGPGIARAHLPRLFERFYRVDHARSRALGGTGLGLAIVKHIALVHGGRAEVESTVGKGSTFRIVLPAGVGAGVTRT